MSESTVPASGAKPSDPHVAWSALARSAAAIALVDAAGTVLGCSRSFAEAVGTDTGAAVGRPAAALLGDAVLALTRPGPDAAGIEIEITGAQGRGSIWQATAVAVGDDLRVLSLHRRDDDLASLKARVAGLEERLDLVQRVTNAGTFERDPKTMQGHWDAHMCRIYGLPSGPDGAPAPPYSTVANMIEPEDRQAGGFAASLAQPGPHSARVRMRRPDGSLRHIHSHWTVFADASGQPQRVLGVNSDVTEVFDLARRAEQLREERDVALQLGGIALWRHDLATDRVHFDGRGLELTGAEPSPEGLTLEQAHALLHPEDVATAIASSESTLRTGAPSDMSLRYRDRSGGWRHVLSRRMLQRDADGRALAFVGVLLDETERVVQARRSIELAQRLEAAAQAARIGLWSAQVGPAPPTWNRRMFELFGLDPAQGALTLGQWLRQRVHPADRDLLAERLSHWVREGQEPVEVEFRVVRPGDLAPRWLVLRGDVDRLTPAGQRRVEGVAIDVTEQHETLRQLRDNLERAALTTEAFGLGTWETHGVEELTIWDEQMFRLRGVNSPRRAIGLAEVASYVHPDDREAVMSSQSLRMHSDQPWASEFRVLWADGTVRWIASRSVARPADDGPERRRIGLNFDITDAKMAEQALRERELAVAENRAKSQFMSRFSHELRTPLNAVLGFTQLMRGEPDEDTRRGWLGHIEEAGRHLLALIDDVLDLSRLGAGEMRLNLQPVRLADLVAATLPLVAGQAQVHEVRLCEPGDLAGVVWADPVRLRQVLLNLLSNAIKYNRPGGLIRLSARGQADSVTLCVADTGLGIDPERLRSAFEPFNRLGAEASTIEGTGIGLAIAKSLVDQMGGRIDVDSRPGEGTVFALSLPAAAQPAVPPRQPGPSALPQAPSPEALQGREPARILYVEDNVVNALLVRELLAPSSAVALEVADNGAQGIARARASLPDLVLLDMQLPDMDGLAVLRSLRADPATAGLRCVALSANAMPDDIEAAMDAGFADYWTKPIHFERFMADLARVLGRPV